MKRFFQKKVSPILYEGVPNISNDIVKVFENCCAVYSILFLRINYQLAFSQNLLANKSSVERKIIHHMCNTNNENLATTKIMRMKMILVILLVMMIETVILIKMVSLDLSDAALSNGDSDKYAD